LDDLSPLPRYLMAIHCRNHDHQTRKQYRGHLLALEDSDHYRNCPLGTCSERYITDLQRHLLDSHSQEERSQFRGEVNAEGFDTLTVHFVCPVPDCEVLSEDKDGLVKHLTFTHLVVDADHLRSLQDQMLVPMVCKLSDFFPWQPWILHWRPGSQDTVCNKCGVEIFGEDSFDEWKPEGTGNVEVTHHLTLLKRSSDLEAGKQQILRLVPEFGTHPIFDTAMPLVHRKNSRVA